MKWKKFLKILLLINMKNKSKIVKVDYDFGWKSGINSHIAEQAFKYNKGSILDIGCATCQLYKYLREKGWQGKYIGMDMKKYSNYHYPKDINLIIGDACKLEFPQVDTCVLYNILEHIETPVELLSKALNCSKNVLLNVPKRNEEMWRFGIAEYHQLDKTHKHCGFTKDEVYKLVDAAGGKIINYKEFGKINGTIALRFYSSKLAKRLILLLDRFFGSKEFYKEIWCEVVKKTL